MVPTNEKADAMNAVLTQPGCELLCWRSAPREQSALVLDESRVPSVQRAPCEPTDGDLRGAPL